VTDHFVLEPDAEVAVEVDPRHNERQQVDLLRTLGFNRLSMGVQDFDPDVQAAVDRNQTEAETRKKYDLGRDRGFASITSTSSTGSPFRRKRSSGRTVDTVIGMRPDRVALYSYAHVPWIRAQQKWIEPKDLPSAEDKLQLFLDSRDRFLADRLRRDRHGPLRASGRRVGRSARQAPPPPQLHGVHGEDGKRHGRGRRLRIGDVRAGLRSERKEALPILRGSGRGALSRSSAAMR
jgi:hypothetical protein